MIQDLNSLKVGQKVWLEAEIVKIGTITINPDNEDIAVRFIGAEIYDYQWVCNSAMKQAHLSLPTSTISIGDEVVLKNSGGESKGILTTAIIKSCNENHYSFEEGTMTPVPINPELQQLKELADRYNFELVKK